MSPALLRHLLFAATLALACVTAAAQEEEDPLAEYRHGFMESLKYHIGGAYALVTGAVSFDGHLILHARALAEQTPHLTSLFPEGSIGKDTRALPVIWQDWAEFESAAEKAAQASQAFLAAVEAEAAPADLVARFKDVGAGCKGCHDKFRAEED